MAINFRKARFEDVPAIADLLANDKLGRLREDLGNLSAYENAFQQIHADVNQELIVGVDETEEVLATLQLTFIQGLTYRGGIRAQIEAVRVNESLRGQGVGEKMINYAIERAKVRKAHMVQLTSDKQRPDAIRFYERLGFKASHEGMKLHLI